MTTSNGDLPIWTIYDRGTDGYDGFTTRCFLVGSDGLRATEDVMHSMAIEVLRQVHQEAGRVCMPRSPGDAVNIVESWL